MHCQLDPYMLPREEAWMGAYLDKWGGGGVAPPAAVLRKMQQDALADQALEEGYEEHRSAAAQQRNSAIPQQRNTATV